MPYSNNIVSKPIDIGRDLAAIWGFSSYDLGYIISNAHSNNLINMWSRKKPVPWSTSSMVVNPQGDHPNDWWKGRNADFGITPKSADTTNVLSFIDGGLNGWVYNIDTLAYRALDFDGYYQGATNPFDFLFLQPDRNEVAPGGTITMQYQLSAGGAATDTNLGIIELNSGLTVGGVKKNISELYAAFIIYQKQSGGSYSYYDWCSASQNLSDLESDPAMHSVQYTAPSTIGDYRIVPVLTTVRKESSSQAIGSFITVPGKTAYDVVVANTVSPYMQVDAFVYNSGTGQNPNFGNTIYFYCEFMGGSQGGTFNNISLGFQTSQGVAYKTLNNVQNQGAATALVVPANSTTRKPAGSGNVYSTPWNSSGITLENFVRSLGGEARIYCATSGSTLAPYTVIVREAAAMPGGQVIPF